MGKDQRHPTGRTDRPRSKELLTRDITDIRFHLDILPDNGGHQVYLFIVTVHSPSSQKVSLVFKYHISGLQYKDERNILSLTQILPMTHLPVLGRWLSYFLLWSSNLRPSQDVFALDPFCFWLLNWRKENRELTNLVTAQPQCCNVFIQLWLRALPFK